MKSSPMILAFLFAATLVRAGEPTPTPHPSPTPPAPSPLSPPDGAVYQVGDPILIEQEFTDGCAGASPGDLFSTARRIRYLDTDPAGVLPLAELSTETLRINLPGNYELVRTCTNSSLTGEATSNTFTVEAPCPLLDPEPTPAPPGAPVPRIIADSLSGGVNVHAVITLDNSMTRLPYLRIKNIGTADLVLIDIFPWIEFDSIIMEPVGFVPYTVVRPGHVYYLGVEAYVTEPSVVRYLGMGNFIFYAKSNDPMQPLVQINVSDFSYFDTSETIPENWILAPGPPANPATPECADQNADGTVDASDVVNFILQR